MTRPTGERRFSREVLGFRSLPRGLDAAVGGVVTVLVDVMTGAPPCCCR
jgi:hypothetical protein